MNKEKEVICPECFGSGKCARWPHYEIETCHTCGGKCCVSYEIYHTYFELWAD